MREGFEASRRQAALRRCLALALLASCGSAAASEPAAPPVRIDSTLGKMPALPPADFDDALEIGGTDINGRKIRTRMTVAVMVNGSGPYRFVVDSGADSSVVGERIANQLKLPSSGRVILNSITDTQIVDRVKVDSLTVGPTEVYNLSLPVLRERDLGAHGMLGLDALVEQRLMLDFEKRVITVDEGRTEGKFLDGEIVVTARLRKGQLILTKVRAGGQRVDAVVDTGSEISIGNSALYDKLMRRARDQFTEIEVTGVTGTVSKLKLAVVKEITLGSVTLHNVPIAFADVPPFQVFGIDEQPSLLLGTDVMETFRKVQLDFHNRKVRFQLKRCNMAAAINVRAVYPTRIVGNDPQACAR